MRKLINSVKNFFDDIEGVEVQSYHDALFKDFLNNRSNQNNSINPKFIEYNSLSKILKKEYKKLKQQEPELFI